MRTIDRIKLKLAAASLHLSRLTLDVWEESKHPRRKDGKFGRGDKNHSILSNKNDKIKEEILVPKSLSAMAKTFFVKNETKVREEGWSLKAGSTVTGVKVIAEGTKIHDIQRLIREYKLPNGANTKAKDWNKVRGTAIVVNNGKEAKAEVHWYQCKNIGKVEFKIKRWYE